MPPPVPATPIRKAPWLGWLDPACYPTLHPREPTSPWPRGKMSKGSEPLSRRNPPMSAPSVTPPPIPVRGRLAPSPTGAQHVGNARTYLIAWLRARSQGGRIVLRIEDIDSPRIKPGTDRQACEDLLWLGLDWDEGPVVQTQRLAHYEQAL